MAYHLTKFIKNILELYKYANEETLTLIRLVYINDLRTITAGGKLRARNMTYIAPELIAHIGEKVKVGLDPNNLDRAYIFFNDKLLCIAENEIKADYDTNSPKTQKAFRQQAKKKVAVKKLTKKIVEIKKTESALLLDEKTKVIEEKQEHILTVDKEEVFDIYNY